MIEPLLKLPGDVRRRVHEALASGVLGPPYSVASVRSSVGSAADAETVSVALEQLQKAGIPPPGIALALEAAASARAELPRPDLVWSGPEVPGLHARDTRRVYEQLIGEAEWSLWASTYAYFDGPKAFKVMAERMDALPDLSVKLLLNITRKWGDTTAAESLIEKFADQFWGSDWPGVRRPNTYYFPRSLDLDGVGHVLHAKAVIADDDAVFVTSANFTEAALDRNIEVGLLSRDRSLATSLALHFQTLIDRQLLAPLPGP